METSYAAGETLIVELENEVLIGDLKLISPDGRMVELTSVRDFNTGYVYTSSQCLPRPLIKSIKRCKTVDGKAPPKTNDEDSQANQDEDLINITDHEINYLQAIVSNATYIAQTDQKYHKALGDIKQQSVISLHVEPTQFGRHNRTSLLTVATCHRVYVFDLALLGKLFKEVKEILQSQRPRKVVYYSNKVADNLKYQHGVKLTGVFDVFVAHCLISKQKQPLSFGQCAVKYFNIPENYFKGEDELEKEIYVRPLPRAHIDVVSKKAIFLYKLYEHLLHNIMLKNFYKQCSEFAVAFAANDDNVEVVMQMRPDSVYGSNSIGDEQWMSLVERKIDFDSSHEED